MKQEAVVRAILKPHGLGTHGLRTKHVRPGDLDGLDASSLGSALVGYKRTPILGSLFRRFALARSLKGPRVGGEPRGIAQSMSRHSLCQ